jgi:hypothetical protein
MTSEIEKLIEAERGQLLDALAQAIEKRDVANREVKRLRAELDAAPRLHVRRTRKAQAPRLPSALEMYPQGIERDPVADLELTSGGEIKVRKAGQ